MHEARRVMKLRGIEQSEIEKVWGLSGASVSRKFTGKASVTLSEFLVLFDFLGFCIVLERRP